MKKFSFRLDNEDSLVLLDCKIGAGNFALALDTGASHTVIGIDISRPVRKVEFETANGVVSVGVAIDEASYLASTKFEQEWYSRKAVVQALREGLEKERRETGFVAIAAGLSDELVAKLAKMKVEEVRVLRGLL